MRTSAQWTWIPGEPCPFCGNVHDEIRVEGAGNSAVAICPPTEQDRMISQVAQQLWLGLQEAAKLEPGSEKIRERLAQIEIEMQRGHVIVTEISR